MTDDCDNHADQDARDSTDDVVVMEMVQTSSEDGL